MKKSVIETGGELDDPAEFNADDEDVDIVFCP